MSEYAAAWGRLELAQAQVLEAEPASDKWFEARAAVVRAENEIMELEK